MPPTTWMYHFEIMLSQTSAERKLEMIYHTLYNFDPKQIFCKYVLSVHSCQARVVTFSNSPSQTFHCGCSLVQHLITTRPENETQPGHAFSINFIQWKIIYRKLKSVFCLLCTAYSTQKCLFYWQAHPYTNFKQAYWKWFCERLQGMWLANRI